MGLPAALAERWLRGREATPRARAAAAVAVWRASAAALLAVEAMLGYAYRLDPAAGAQAVERWLATLRQQWPLMAGVALASTVPFPLPALVRAGGRGLAAQVAACAVAALAALPALAWTWPALSGAFVVGPGVVAGAFVGLSAALPLLLRLADAVERALARWAGA